MMTWQQPPKPRANLAKANWEKPKYRALLLQLSLLEYTRAQLLQLPCELSA